MSFILTFLFLGMSLVHEVIAARHCNMTVFAMCLVSNMVVLEYDTEVFVNELEVMEMGSQRSQDFIKFIKKMLTLMGPGISN